VELIFHIISNNSRHIPVMTVAYRSCTNLLSSSACWFLHKKVSRVSGEFRDPT